MKDDRLLGKILLGLHFSHFSVISFQFLSKDDVFNAFFNSEFQSYNRINIQFFFIYNILNKIFPSSMLDIINTHYDRCKESISINRQKKKTIGITPRF